MFGYKKWHIGWPNINSETNFISQKGGIFEALITFGWIPKFEGSQDQENARERKDLLSELTANSQPVNFCRAMDVSKHKTDMVGVKKMGLLWVERVRKKKKSKETELEPKEDLVEKRRNSADLPICFFEGRRVSVS